jgi:hypothetical protein
VSLLRQLLEFTVRLGRDQIGKAMEKLRFLQRQVIQKRRERHRHNFARGRCFAIRLSLPKKTPGTHTVFPALCLDYTALFRTRS